MSLCSLLYVSKSTLAEDRADAVVREIVGSATLANAAIYVTGALVFTGRHFAQILEGESDRIDRLIGTVVDDPRHEDVTIIDRTKINQRRFSEWSLAYLGPSQFVSRHVTQLLRQNSVEQQRRAAAWVADLMVEFAAGP